MQMDVARRKGDVTDGVVLESRHAVVQVRVERLTQSVHECSCRGPPVVQSRKVEASNRRHETQFPLDPRRRWSFVGRSRATDPQAEGERQEQPCPHDAHRYRGSRPWGRRSERSEGLDRSTGRIRVRLMASSLVIRVSPRLAGDFPLTALPDKAEQESSALIDPHKERPGMFLRVTQDPRQRFGQNLAHAPPSDVFPREDEDPRARVDNRPSPQGRSESSCPCVRTIQFSAPARASQRSSGSSCRKTSSCSRTLGWTARIASPTTCLPMDRSMKTVRRIRRLATHTEWPLEWPGGESKWATARQDSPAWDRWQLQPSVHRNPRRSGDRIRPWDRSPRVEAQRATARTNG